MENNVGYIALSVDNFVEVKQWYEEEVNLFTVSELLVNPEKTEHGRRVLRTSDPAGHSVELFEVIEEDAIQDLSLEKPEQ
jgi:hypothetical protein